AGSRRLVPRPARGLQSPGGDPRARRDPAHPDREGAAQADRGTTRAVKVAVVGAGAIGAYVGAALERGGADVTLIARGPHLRAMQERGVRVLSPRGDFEARPAATNDLDAVGDAELVFVALKAYSLPELAPRLGASLARGAAVIAAQNGIPWWYFQSHGGPLESTVLESVDP